MSESDADFPKSHLPVECQAGHILGKDAAYQLEETQPLCFGAQCLERDSPSAAAAVLAVDIDRVLGDRVVAHARAVCAGAGPGHDLAVR